jgi:hypothetical protein
MYVQVDLAATPPAVTLEEPEDTKRFQVTVVGGDSVGLVFGALVDAAAGRLDGDDAQGPIAWIAVDAVRRMARGRVGPEWDAELDGMLAYAKGKGWLDDNGNAIRAHLEFA